MWIQDHCRIAKCIPWLTIKEKSYCSLLYQQNPQRDTNQTADVWLVFLIWGPCLHRWGPCSDQGWRISVPIKRPDPGTIYRGCLNLTRYLSRRVVYSIQSVSKPFRGDMLIHTGKPPPQPRDLGWLVVIRWWHSDHRWRPVAADVSWQFDTGSSSENCNVADSNLDFDRPNRSHRWRVASRPRR